MIVAGGAGLRMGTDTPKQFLLLQGKPILCHTAEAFLQAFEDIKIVLVIPALHENTAAWVVALLSDPSRIQITAGGNTRYQSVKNGLKLVEQDAIVMVHDGVRCLVTTTLIKRCYEAAVKNGNAVPAIPATDSIRFGSNDVNEPVDRNLVKIIQTPQTFLAGQLISAFNQPFHDSFTDEAIVLEKTGVAVHLVDGETTNIKITSPADLLVAESLLHTRLRSNV